MYDLDTANHMNKRSYDPMHKHSCSVHINVLEWFQHKLPRRNGICCECKAELFDLEDRVDLTGKYPDNICWLC